MFWEPQMEKLNNGKFHWIALLAVLGAGVLA